jgi:hypothetical protein
MMDFLLSKKITKNLFVLLLVISILSIIFIKFSPLKDMPSPEFFPYGYELGEVVFDLSIGYIVSAIFYFLVVFIPEKKRNKSARVIVQSRLELIAHQMRLSLLYLCNKYEIKDDFDKLDEHHFADVLKVENVVMGIRYEEKVKNNWNRTDTGGTTELQHFFSERNSVTRLIEEIFNIPAVINIDFELIEILAQIKHCWFYAAVKALAESSNLENTTVLNFNKHVFDYYILYLRLRKYVNLNDFKLYSRN